MTGIKAFEQSLNKTNEWIGDVKRELHYENEQDAYVAMRAVLHALRDRLPVPEAANLAAQLPLVVSGLYYENWEPSNKPLKIKDLQEFLDKVGEELPDNKKYEANRITEGFIKTLKKHVSAGEIDEIKQHFPADLKGIMDV